MGVSVRWIGLVVLYWFHLGNDYSTICVFVSSSCLIILLLKIVIYSLV